MLIKRVTLISAGWILLESQLMKTDRNRMSDTTLVLYVKKLLVPIIFRHGNVESTGIIEISMILPVSMMV